MASRRADQSRSHYDDRGGGRYSAARRDDRYDRDRDRYHDNRRDDRRDDRRGDDRYDRDRDRERDRGERRRDDRRDRDRDRDRDSYRRRSRSRSPARRDRSRDRHPDGRRSGRDEYRDRDRLSPRDDYRRSDDRYRASKSSERPAGSRPGSRGGELSREDRLKRDQETQKQDEEAKKAARLLRMEEWKKKQLAKKASEAASAVSSPLATGPSTPAAAATSPPASEAAEDSTKAKVAVKATAEKKTKQVKEPFKLDQSAAVRPAAFKSTANSKAVLPADRPTLPSSKKNGNIGTFGLKTKAPNNEATAVKKVVLDDGDNSGKRSLQALTDFTPLEGDGEEALETADADDDVMSDIGSGDEDTQAQVQAQLEKRREEMANEDTQMEEAPVVADESNGKMDVDDVAGDQDDDVDPLDAFMADLTETRPRAAALRAETMFSDDHEPELTAVEDEDLFALASAKKKKKEVAVVDHSKVEYEPFRKDFYTESAEITQMTPEEVADLRHELDGIKVRPDTVPRPVVKWAQMGLLQATMDVFARVRYETPTPIQAQAIPIAESGMDLIGVAKTGSGKTLAFGIPMIRHILDQRQLKNMDGPIGLILAPTRELSLQIANELKPFLKASGLHIACAYGGAPISEQIGLMKRGGIHVLCATPGRLIDLLQSNSGRVLNLKRVTYVVLDEADRMFDMGFEPQVMKILGNVRPDRQAILFSATLPKNMAALARKALSKPVEVTVGGRSVVAPEVTQVIRVLPTSYDEKVKELLRSLGQFFQEDENGQALVFVERQETAEDLLSKLFKSQYTGVNSIHGAKDQTDRNEAINDFKQGVLPILIATSVAARGLDVPGLALVLNFDSPTHLEDYVHRCGRTGRAGNKGTAITFVEKPGQERFAKFIVKALKESGSPVPDDVLEMAAEFDKKLAAGAEKYFGGFGGKGLDKLDAARDMEKRREKRLHKIEGEDASDDEETPAGKLPEVLAAGAAPKAADAGDGLPEYMALLSGKIIVNKTERPAAEAGKPMTAKERAMAAANKVDGRLSKMKQIHHGQPLDNKGPDAGLYHATIPINPFPQKARWAVTNRTNVVKILDSTGVSITTKGTYYAPGKEPGPDDLPKLYILVEGDTENLVTSAMLEIQRLLKEATLAVLDEQATRGATGRYSVL